MLGDLATRRSVRATAQPYGTQARKALSARVKAIRQRQGLRIEDVGDRMVTAPPEIGEARRDAFTTVLYGKAGAGAETLRVIAYGLDVDPWDEMPEYRAAILREALDPAQVGPDRMQALLDVLEQVPGLRRIVERDPRETAVAVAEEDAAQPIAPKPRASSPGKPGRRRGGRAA